MDIRKKLKESILRRMRESSESRLDLIKAAQGGDSEAFEKLLKSHKDLIRRVSSKYFIDNGDQNDIEQEANIAFWNAVMQFDGKGDFEAYAGMFIKRALSQLIATDSAEKNQILSRSQSFDTPVADDGEGGESTLGNLIPDKSGSAEDRFLGTEGAKDIIDFLQAKLSDQEREVIFLSIEGYKTGEIAEELGMEYKKVENAKKRVKDKLADYMRAKGQMKEGKQIDESAEIEFSDAEKKILKQALSHIEIQESIKESKIPKKKIKR